MEHVAGYTLCNEGTLRDWVRHAKFNVTQGKNFDASGSLGPYFVSADEIDPAKPLHLVTKVNGEVRQDDTTANLIFGFADLHRLHHDLHHAQTRRHHRDRHAGRRRARASIRRAGSSPATWWKSRFRSSESCAMRSSTRRKRSSQVLRSLEAFQTAMKPPRRN